ncbi:septation protein SpoVG family protein [bacterium]|nr:septation protein SpoVG family protein [bacterium]
MNITEIRVHVVGREDTNLRAYASVTLDGAFVIHGIKIIEGERGLFVGMPRRKREDGSSQDVCHPINNTTRYQMEERILAAYHQELAHPGSTRKSQPMGGSVPDFDGSGFYVE